MLEQADTLAAWRLSADPTGPGAFPIDCLRIQDHRKRYLDYEGPISGGRGSVSRVDGGTYDRAGDSRQACTITFHGLRLRGSFRLSRRGAEPDPNWALDPV